MLTMLYSISRLHPTHCGHSYHRIERTKCSRSSLDFWNVFPLLARYGIILWYIFPTAQQVYLFVVGAVDSVIYTTTRKLIKPINFPNHMRTLSRDTSITKGDAVTLSRNPSSFKRPSVGDKPSCDPPGSPRYSNPSVHKAGVCHDANSDAIRVTLERIQEII
jgi:hypothetical protein